MKNLLKISAMLVLTALVVFSTHAQQRTAAPEKKKQMKIEKHAMIPDLTDAQKDQMKAIHIKTLKATQSLKNELMEKKAHLKTLSTAEKADMKAINKQIDEISGLQASIQKQKAASKQEVRSILTDDQRVIFDSHSGEMMHGRDGKQRKHMKKDGHSPHGNSEKR